MLQMTWAMGGQIEDPTTWDWIAYVLSQFPTLSSQNVSGYTDVVSQYPNPFGSDPPYLAGIGGSVVLQDTSDPNEILARFEPIVAHINAVWPGKMTSFNQTTAYDTFLEWFDANYDMGYAGNDTYIGSRLLDERALTADLSKLSTAVRNTSTITGLQQFNLVSGKGVFDAKPRGGSNAVNPAWRRAYTHSSM